jgi:SAM-dependent methyltransferase
VTGAHYVRELQYRTEDNLVARQSIYVYQQPRVDMWNRALDLAALQGDESVLDVGCGNGAYLRTLARRGHDGMIVGADLSPGMLDAARARTKHPRLMIADVQQAPFCDASFDLVMAMHMLYHAPDRALAIRELRRVMRDDGVALVVTNSELHLRELDELITAAAGGEILLSNRMTFTLAAGEAELGAAFSRVERHDFPGELLVTDVQPVVDYVSSMRAFITGDQDAVLDDLRRRAAGVIDRDGVFRVHTHAGCFVCRS